MSGTPPDTITEQNDPLIGRVIAGSFVLERRLGGGSMGAVYLAQQTALERPVAIKVMRAEFATDTTYAERFRREAKAASRLDHPNLIRVYDCGQEPDGLLYIVMEYLDCRDLFTVFSEDWPLPHERTVDILSQALSGLAEAHDAGVLHRDLKPENIMVLRRKAEDGGPVDVVKVCDFGIAKFVEPLDKSKTDGAAERRKLTTAGLVIGTPEYMSPEQARAESYDVRSDLYAVGVILYQLLTRRLPFEGKTSIAVVFKAMHEEPKTLDSHGVTAAPGLDPICIKAMSRRPEDRYQSAREMRAALQTARVTPAHRAEPSFAPAPTKEEPEHPPRWAGKNARISAPRATKTSGRRLGGVLAAVAAVVGATSLIDEWRPPLPAAPPSASFSPLAGASSHLAGASSSLPVDGVQLSARPEPPAPSTVAPAPSLRPPSPLAQPPPTPSDTTLPLPRHGFPRDIPQAIVALPEARAPSLVATEASSSFAETTSVSAYAPSLIAPPSAPPVSSIPPAQSVPIPNPLAPSETPATFDPGTARVELGQVTCNSAAVTRGSVKRALGPLIARFTTCYRRALAEGASATSGGVATLHLESDDGGYVTVARVTGASASVARCIEERSHNVHFEVDTGAANVDVTLLLQPP